MACKDSLTKTIQLYELKSPGKSGSFFYYSKDFRFIIKTITFEEAEFFRSFLCNYYQVVTNRIIDLFPQHIMQVKNTLLCIFFGLHAVQLRGGSEMYFVVMSNAFDPSFEIHERYDLKVS